MTILTADPDLTTQGHGVQIMDAAEITATLQRMARQIVEHQPDGFSALALIGIYTRGVEVARRLCDQIESLAGTRPAYGVLDISMHRDDLRRRPRLTSIQPTHLPVDLEARTVILVDDVFFTGRSSTPWANTDAPRVSSWRLWWTGGTGNCLFDRTSRVKVSRPVCRTGCW